MKRAALVSFLLLAAPVVANADPIPSTITVQRLVRSRPPTEATVEIDALPVQIGELDGGIRVPQRGVPSLRSVHPATETPSLVRGIEPRFDSRSIPLIPFAGFRVAIVNQGDAPITIAPNELTLEANGKRYEPISDSGALYGRFRLDIDALRTRHSGVPEVGWTIDAQFRELPFMKGSVTIPAHGHWVGLLVFDVGAYNADEYNAFLAKAGAVAIVLTGPSTAPVSVAFATQAQQLPAVCLPETKQPSFLRCEVVE